MNTQERAEENRARAVAEEEAKAVAQKHAEEITAELSSRILGKAKAEVRQAREEADAAILEIRRRDAEREKEERATQATRETNAQLAAAVENSGLPFDETLKLITDEKRPWRFGRDSFGSLTVLDSQTGGPYKVQGQRVFLPDILAVVREERPDLVVKMKSGPQKVRSMIAGAFKGKRAAEIARTREDGPLRKKVTRPQDQIRLAMRPGAGKVEPTAERQLSPAEEAIRQAFNKGNSSGA